MAITFYNTSYIDALTSRMSTIESVVQNYAQKSDLQNWTTTYIEAFSTIYSAWYGSPSQEMVSTEIPQSGLYQTWKSQYNSIITTFSELQTQQTNFLNWYCGNTIPLPTAVAGGVSSLWNTLYMSWSNASTVSANWGIWQSWCSNINSTTRGIWPSWYNASTVSANWGIWQSWCSNINSTTRGIWPSWYNESTTKTDWGMWQSWYHSDTNRTNWGMWQSWYNESANSANWGMWQSWNYISSEWYANDGIQSQINFFKNLPYFIGRDLITYQYGSITKWSTSHWTTGTTASLTVGWSTTSSLSILRDTIKTLGWSTTGTSTANTSKIYVKQSLVTSPAMQNNENTRPFVAILPFPHVGTWTATISFTAFPLRLLSDGTGNSTTFTNSAPNFKLIGFISTTSTIMSYASLLATCGADTMILGTNPTGKLILNTAHSMSTITTKISAMNDTGYNFMHDVSDQKKYLYCYMSYVYSSGYSQALLPSTYNITMYQTETGSAQYINRYLRTIWTSLSAQFTNIL